jgi:hypothetical protein
MAKSSTQGMQQQQDYAAAGAQAAFGAQQAQQQGQWQVEDAERAAAEQTIARQEEAQADLARDKDLVIRASKAKIQAEEKRASDLTKREPDPTRLWNNQKTATKAAWLIAIFANEAAQNRKNPGGPNSSLQALRGLIERDVDEQSKSLYRQRQDSMAKISALKDEKSEALASASERYSQQLARIQSLDRMAMAKAKTVSRGSAQEAGYQLFRQGLFGMYQEIAAKRTQTLVQNETQSRSFAHDERMAVRQRAWQVEDQDKAAQLALQKAQIEAQAKGFEANKDHRFIPSESGLMLATRDAKGNLLPVNPAEAQLHKDYVEKATETSVKANQLYTDLLDFDRMIGDKDNWDAIFQSDGEVNSKFIEIAREIATNPAFNKGVTANADVGQAGDLLSGRAFQRGAGESLASFTQRMDMLKASVKQYIKNLPDETNRQLKMFPGVAPGQNLYWQPPADKPPIDPNAGDKYLLPGEKEARLSQSIDAKAGITPQPAVPALDAAGFKQPLVDENPTPTKLKPMTDEQVAQAQKLEQDAEGLTTRRHRELAAATLKDSDARKRYMIANEGKLQETAAKEYDVARRILQKAEGLGDGVGGALSRLRGPRDVAEPDTALVKDQLRAAGFNVTALTPKDIKYMKELVVRVAKNPNAGPAGDTVAETEAPATPTWPSSNQLPAWTDGAGRYTR